MELYRFLMTVCICLTSCGFANGQDCSGKKNCKDCIKADCKGWCTAGSGSCLAESEPCRVGFTNFPIAGSLEACKDVDDNNGDDDECSKLTSIGSIAALPSTCRSCTAKPECGYCLSSKKCVKGDKTGPTSAKCKPIDWRFDVCDYWRCLERPTCADCLEQKPDQCVWCASERKCVGGSPDGPVEAKTCARRTPDWPLSTKYFLTSLFDICPFRIPSAFDRVGKRGLCKPASSAEAPVSYKGISLEECFEKCMESDCSYVDFHAVHVFDKTNTCRVFTGSIASTLDLSYPLPFGVCWKYNKPSQIIEPPEDFTEPAEGGFNGFCRTDGRKKKGNYDVVCSGKKKKPCTLEECAEKCRADPLCLAIEYYHDRGKSTGNCELHYQYVSRTAGGSGAVCFVHDRNAIAEVPSAPSSKWNLIGEGYCRGSKRKSGPYLLACGSKSSGCTFERCLQHCEVLDIACYGVEYVHEQGKKVGRCELHLEEVSRIKSKDGVTCWSNLAHSE